MSLSTSRYAKPPKVRTKNQWREYTISEGNMTDLIASFLASVDKSVIRRVDDVTRVVIGDLAEGQYVLAVEFKGKEDKKVG